MMKTTLNRSDVYRFERLVSKLVKSSELPGTIAFSSCSDGLQFIAFTDTAVLSMTVPSVEVIQPFTLPWAVVKECATKKNGEIELDIQANSVLLTWSENGVPQYKTVPSLGLADKRLPVKPDNTVAHSSTLFDALVDAGKCVDPENSRYSLGAVCLRGSKAQIVSTDGRQALVQDGFAFPWEDDVLCPVTKIFNSKELRDCGDTVRIGCEADWIYFQAENVTFWLKQIDGKFPQMDQFTKQIDHFTWLNVDPDDSNFVAQRLESLPGKTDRESPVYVALSDHISVRGHDRIQQTTTELRFSRSRYDGKELTMSMNRRFLKNALDYGIDRLGFDPNERSPLVGYGNRKTFIIMPLEGDEPKVDPDKVTLLASDNMPSVPLKSAKAVKAKTLPPTITVAARNVKSEISHENPVEQMDVIAATEGLCQTLAETLQITRRLVRSLKQQRKQNRLMRQTIASLKQLQGV